MAKVTVEQVRKRLARGFYTKMHPVDGSARFYEDAMESLSLKGHPKGGKAFTLAYEHGHSGGRAEVFGYLQELAELLVD